MVFGVIIDALGAQGTICAVAVMTDSGAVRRDRATPGVGFCDGNRTLSIDVWKS